MVTASELLQGMTIRIDGEIYRVLEAESKSGTAKMGGVVKTKLVNARSGRFWEPHFRPNQRMEEVRVDRRLMEFLFGQGDLCTFMHSDTFEQIDVPRTILGPAADFLQPGMELPIDFFEGTAIGAAFPEVAEARIARTAPASHAAQDNAWKDAILENGLTILVPLFIAPGETVRVDVKTGRYVERLQAERKHAA